MWGDRPITTGLSSRRLAGRSGNTKRALKRPAAARRTIERTLDKLVSPHDVIEARSPLPNALHAYDGATLLDAHGVRIGEIDRFQTIGGQPTAILRLGGWTDFFGIFDFGGAEVSVPADELLFGHKQTLGSLLVVLPRSPPGATPRGEPTLASRP